MSWQFFVSWIFWALVQANSGILKLSVDRYSKRSLEYGPTILNNSDVQYLVELQVGTPPQTVTVQLDTGSSDLWLMSSENSNCPESSRCPAEYVFNISMSNTLRRNDSDFELMYGDGTGANGSYYTDNLRIGDLNISNANFGVANYSDTAPSVLGIGFADNEAVVDTAPIYPNLPMQMKAQGLIDRITYSLWLGRASSPTGQIFFGGLDHAKYNGSLITVPIVNPDSDGEPPYGFHVMLHEIWIYGSNGPDSSEIIVECSYPGLLDSGSSGVALPRSMARAVLYSLGAGLDVDNAVWVVPCDQPGGLLFSFSGKVLSVPFSDLVYPLPQATGMCMLGIDFRADGGCIFGDSFLRSVYAVFDLENREVSLAQMNDSDQEALEKIKDGVPGATRAPSYSSTLIASDMSLQIASSVFGQTSIHLTTVEYRGVSSTLRSEKISQITASLAATASNGAHQLDWSFTLLKLLLYVL